jgi:hypothetical protein
MRKVKTQRMETPTFFEEGIEITRTEPVVLEVEQDGQILSHLILFEIKTRLAPSKEGLVIDGDIKETIYQMREF